LSSTKFRPIAALAAALAFVGGTALTACNTGEPDCPKGQVAEYDDDGWECEPDEDGDGRDDEGSDWDWTKHKKSNSFKNNTTKKR
jgi:hypothetical protein